MQERKKAMRKALQFEALALIDSKDHAPFVPFPWPLGGRPKGKGEISKWVEGNFEIKALGHSTSCLGVRWRICLTRYIQLRN